MLGYFQLSTEEMLPNLLAPKYRFYFNKQEGF